MAEVPLATATAAATTPATADPEKTTTPPPTTTSTTSTSTPPAPTPLVETPGPAPDPNLPAQEAAPRTWRFWLVFASMCMVSLSTSLDTTMVVTSLPTIVKAVGGADQYVWIGNSFLLASTVVQPALGQLADLFGRRWPMLVSLSLFILGSGIAGGAKDPAMLMGGRVVQGMGAGGIFVLLDIITSDLVPLRERGQFLGLVLSTGAIGSTLGPIVGGALAQSSWRWVFYITIPTAGAGLAALAAFLRMASAHTSPRVVLKRVDWTGSTLFIAAITSVLLALIMGGIVHPWKSAHVVVPLTVGFAGWIAFHAFEASPFCSYPSIPPHLFTNRTSLTAFVLTLLSGMLLMWPVVFLPVYFQGVKGTTALTSGVYLLPFSIFIVPAGIVAGAAMSILGRFKPLHWAGFAISAIGYGLLSMLTVKSHRAAWVCYQIVTAVGTGVSLTTMLPAIQSALAEADQAKATAMFSFMRSFGMVWGMTIPAIVFNGEFDRYLDSIGDASVVANLSGGRAYGFVSGDYIQTLDPIVRDQVISVYTRALRTCWLVGVAFCLLGFALVFVEEHYEMRKELETEYGLQQGPASGEVRKEDPGA